MSAVIRMPQRDIDKADENRQLKIFRFSPEILISMIIELSRGSKLVIESPEGRTREITAIGNPLPKDAEISRRGNTRIAYDPDTDSFVTRIVSSEFKSVGEGLPLEHLEPTIFQETRRAGIIKDGLLREACELAFEYTNTGYVLTKEARHDLCQRTFEACKTALGR